MKLYFSPASPFVRKVMLVLYLKNMVDRVQLVAGRGTPTQPNKETLSVNPLGKIPALATESGEILYDSRVICRYLDRQSGGGLYPTDNSEFTVLTREALADGILDAAVLAVYENRLRPEGMRHQPILDAMNAKVERGLAAFETGADAVTAGALSIDKIGVACALGYLDFRFPGLNWRSKARKLTAWYDEFRETPAMLATAPREG
ncbi:MAG: glutathione S-transferase N-terminal domain-containing protein [Pseudomonadota bacterium]